MLFRSHAWMPRTASGFCAVMHVIALVPCTPSAAKVLRSAWMPAPPPLSDPAIVSATASGVRFDMGPSYYLCPSVSICGCNELRRLEFCRMGLHGRHVVW